METAADTAKANAKTSISALIANYSKYDYVQKAADALNAAIKKCLTAAQVAEYIGTGESGTLDGKTKAESVALKDALAQAEIDEALAAGDAAAAAALKAAKTTATGAVTSAMTTGGADVSKYPDVKKAADALNAAINACTKTTGDAGDTAAVSTYYGTYTPEGGVETTGLIPTQALVKALNDAIAAARVADSALQALNTAKTNATTAIDAWVTSQLTTAGITETADQNAVKTAVAAEIKTVKDAIQNCQLVADVNKIATGSEANTVVESQADVKALKTALTAAIAAQDLKSEKAAAKVAVTTACKGFDAVTEVAAAKKALVDAIEACDDATALAKYWNGTALTSDALVTALTGAVTAALTAEKAAASTALDEAADAAKAAVPADDAKKTEKDAAITAALNTAKTAVTNATDKAGVATAKSEGITSINGAAATVQ